MAPTEKMPMVRSLPFHWSDWAGTIDAQAYDQHKGDSFLIQLANNITKTPF